MLLVVSLEEAVETVCRDRTKQEKEGILPGEL